MSKKIRFDLEMIDDEDTPESLPRFERFGQKRVPRPTQTRSKTSEPKQSYEANADVQRWLQQQGFDEVEGAEKPPFQPTFLAGQRDALWLMSSLSLFYQEDLITDVLHVVKSGKEASVYCCKAHPATGLEYVAAKVYRPRMFRNLSNDAVYRENRLLHDADGQVVNKRRSRMISSLKTQKGRAAQMQAWIGYEYHTQQLLSEAGADVPRPLAQMGNAVLMEYIGEPGVAAPRLYETNLPENDVPRLFDAIMHNIELALSCSRVHGDLSEYNILYWQGEIKIIDFAQAVDPGMSENVYPLFLRDVERVCSYFTRYYGFEQDPNAIAWEMWHRQLGG